MQPGTRACYGASAVGTFSGLLLIASGCIIVLHTSYIDHAVGYNIYFLVSVMTIAGFVVLIPSLLCCSCALCKHTNDNSVYPMDVEKTTDGQWAAKESGPRIWTVEGARPDWESPAPQVEDMEELKEDTAQEEPEQDEPAEQQQPEETKAEDS